MVGRSPCLSSYDCLDAGPLPIDALPSRVVTTINHHHQPKRALSMPFKSPNPNAHPPLDQRPLCRVPSCLKHVATWSFHCQQHAYRRNKYGHPEAKALRWSYMNAYVKQAQIVMEANAQHEGLRLAEDEIARAFRQSQQDVAECRRLGRKPDPLRLGLVKLANDFVSPLDCIARFVAVALYDRRHPGAIPDQRSYRVAIGRLVLGLVKGQRYMKVGWVNRLGGLMVDRYAALAAGLVLAIEQTESEARARSDRMALPFKPREFKVGRMITRPLPNKAGQWDSDDLDDVDPVISLKPGASSC